MATADIGCGLMILKMWVKVRENYRLKWSIDPAKSQIADLWRDS
jgi:hypothetical protein